MSKKKQVPKLFSVIEFTDKEGNRLQGAIVEWWSTTVAEVEVCNERGETLGFYDVDFTDPEASVGVVQF